MEAFKKIHSAEIKIHNKYPQNKKSGQLPPVQVALTANPYEGSQTGDKKISGKGLFCCFRNWRFTMRGIRQGRASVVW